MNLYYGYLKSLFQNFYNDKYNEDEYYFSLIVDDKVYSSLYYVFIFDYSDLFIQNKYNSKLIVIGYYTKPKIDMKIFKRFEI